MVCLLIALNRRRDVMRIVSTASVMLLLSGFTWAQSDEVEQLKQLVEQQKNEIEDLKVRLARIENLLGTNTPLSVQPVTYSPRPQAETNQAPPVAPSLAGIRLSGEVRMRFESTTRGSTPSAPGLQTNRGRYRLQLNADRTIGPALNLRVQLASGAVNNGIAFFQDMAGGVTHQPFFISEAYADFHPTPNVSFRAGRMEEVFADNSRFLWDDDIRFNGVNERWKLGRVEFRAGQYPLINPDLLSVPATSPLTLAGVKPGSIARASQMFHQGAIVDLPINKQWRQQLTADIHLYRNPNLIALTSTAAGIGATVAPAIGLPTSGPAPGLGNATRSPGSAILFAPRYQVARAVYRLDSNGLGGKPRLPMTWMIQASRNIGTSRLRDAVLTTFSVGRTTEAGDMRSLYSFTIKEANSLISQLTDDEMGTGQGVNIATHHFRFDYTIHPNVLFSNYLWIQTERNSSNPAASFFVPLGRETPRTWRFATQLGFSF
jgi:Putative porin